MIPKLAVKNSEYLLFHTVSEDRGSGGSLAGGFWAKDSYEVSFNQEGLGAI